MLKPETHTLFSRSNYDLNKYWLTQDSLHNVDYDMFWSPFSIYTCQAGCKVCYISKELDESAKTLLTQSEPVISKELEDYWFTWFSYFKEVGFSDDLKFISLNFPNTYAWIKNNAFRFSYCLTDNALLRQYDLLVNDIRFTSIKDISLSDSFLCLPGMLEKVLDRITGLNKIFLIKQIKLIITNPEIKPEVKTLISLIDELNLNHLIHYDFKDELNLRYTVGKALNYNDWTFSQNKKLFEIKKETVQLFGTTWYFSSQDATLGNWFWKSKELEVEPEKLLVNILLGKIRLYKELSKIITPKDTLSVQFKSYFELPSTYKVNLDFNFIPHMIISNKAQIVTALLSNGWIQTDLGLYKDTGNSVTSIIEPLKENK